MPRPTRVALALGSGGARGYAHIGVIETLEERGYEIVSIAGTSMGALVGGLRAADRLQEYVDWVTSLSQRDVLRLLDPSLRQPGMIRGERILGRMSALVRDTAIEDLAIPFTAVATDLLARKEVWFQRGSLDAAIRASIALPSIFPPVVLNGRLLVDGGLMDPIPIAATAAAAADLTVAVALSEEHLAPAGAAVQESAEPQPRDDWLEPYRQAAAQMFDVDMVRTVSNWFSRTEVSDESGGVMEALPPGLRTTDVMQMALEALQAVVTRYRLAGYPPDIMITVPRASCRTLDFHRAGEMIALGRARTAAALDQETSSRSR